MKIKKVLLSGFKQYKEQLTFDDFMAANGKGKSNFFSAIQFVLSDMMQFARQEQRQALIHEGIGERIMNAYVEIHFDNSEHRFPIDKDEVVLRRSIGLKKDEYFLNKKHVTRIDVMNLLESAGFSRSNPFYIVKQFYVKQGATMKDRERLELLREVAGTKVYDERREESTKILTETESQLTRIEDLVSSITERLGELENEKGELEEFQRLDKAQRALEYTLFNKEYERAVTSLEAIETQRSTKSQSATDLSRKQNLAHDTTVQKQQELKQVQSAVDESQRERDSVEESVKADLLAKSELSLAVESSKKRSADAKKSEADNTKKLATLHKDLEEAQQSLAQIQPKFEAQAAREQELREQNASAKRRLNELYAKQGRKARFKTKQQRDEWIQSELKQLDLDIKDGEKQRQESQKTVTEQEGRYNSQKKKIEELGANMETLTKSIDTARQAQARFRQERDTAQNQLKEMQIQANQADSRARNARDNLMVQKRRLAMTADKMVSQALQAIESIVAERNIRGVHGPLIELFEVDDDFRTAVEVTAGSSLFYVVVDNDETAGKLLKILNEERLGRITFIPLNRLERYTAVLPDTNEAKPMLSQLRFEPQFKNAFAHIFGQTLICRNLEIAASYSRNSDFHCITLDGDQVNKRGAFTGGFYNIKESRLEIQKQINYWRTQLSASETQRDSLKTSVAKVETQITNLSSKLQTETEKVAKSSNERELMKIERTSLAKSQMDIHENLQEQERNLATVAGMLQHLNDTRKSYQKELGSELSDKLTPAEVKEQTDLSSRVTTNEKLLMSITQEKGKLEREMNSLKTQLSKNLSQQQSELEDLIRVAKERLAEEQLTIKSSEHGLGLVEARLKSNEARKTKIDLEFQQKAGQVEKLKKEIEKCKDSENAFASALAEQAKEMEKLLTSRAIQLNKRDECMRKIRELGSLPTEELQRYEKLSQSKLHSELEGVKSKKKKLGNVNRKAFDQYLHFTERQGQLSARKEELDVAKQSINELISNLDQKKDEAVARTFKGVAGKFAEVFAELSGGGEGAVVMYNAGNVEVEEKRIDQLIGTITGIGLKVQFPGQDGAQNIELLSGGQRTLVALSLIFAIQQCDPAPFYLFDEIDSALDPEARARVADLIRRLSKSEEIQFIMAGFHPELLRICHNHYEVIWNERTKVSHIEQCPKERALKVQEEARKEIAAAGKRKKPTKDE